jgi:murein L,D-transpeptidase YafK
MKSKFSFNKLPKPAKISLTILLSMGIVGVAYSLLQKLGYIFPIALWREVTCETCTKDVAYHQPPAGNNFINQDRSIANILGDRIDKQQTSILIEKSKYRLTIYQHRQPIKSYPIVLGDNPTGDKFIEGDRRTPEGIFHLKAMYPHSQWSKFIWFDYPNARSWQKHLTAKQTGKIPWYATIGGNVGIHGVPTNGDAMVDKQFN